MAVWEKQEWLQKLGGLHAQSAFGALGGELVRLTDDELELRLTMTDATRTPFGLLHGGISTFLAETAASTHACWGVDLEQTLPVGIEINASHLLSVKEGELKAVARVLRRSKRLVVHDVEITHLGSGELLSKARVTNYYKRLNPQA